MRDTWILICLVQTTVDHKLTWVGHGPLYATVPFILRAHTARHSYLQRREEMVKGGGGGGRSTQHVPTPTVTLLAGGCGVLLQNLLLPASSVTVGGGIVLCACQETYTLKCN